MLDKTPQGHPAGFPFHGNPPPPSAFPCRCLGFSVVPCPGFPFRASITAFPTTTFPIGRSPWGFPSSRSYLFLHATACGLRRTFPSSPYRMLLCCLRRSLTPSTSATISFRSCTNISGCAVTPAAYRILCVRFAQLLFAGCPTPHWTQHSIRVGGYPLPDRDSHPARYAKLLGAITINSMGKVKCFWGIRFSWISFKHMSAAA